jgi:glycosyltransferase involved in cell wall biosynthesis
MYTPTSDGGHARYTWELLTALAEQPQHDTAGKFAFELVTSSDLAPRFRSELYPVHAILPPLSERGSFGSSAAWVADRLTHYPRREALFLEWLRGRPDVAGVHFQEWTPWLAGRVIRAIRRMGKRVFYTAHNVVPHRRPPFVPGWMMVRWFRNGCRACDGLFVHTDHLATKLSRSLGAPHPAIHVVPHGVWTIARGPRDPSVRERLAWKRLLFFGAIRRNKGLDLLLRAMEHLGDYSLTIAGMPLEPEYFHGEIIPWVSRLRTAGARIELMDGFVPEEDVPALLARHSAAVMPYTEQFVAQSGVVFLALAHELPVVASEAGGLRELFGQFPIGATFQQRTPEALAAAIRSLETADAPALLGAIRGAQRRFSWDDAARATLAGYAAVFGPALPTATTIAPAATEDGRACEVTATTTASPVAASA